MAYSWADLANKLRLTSRELENLRRKDDAPKNRNIKEWRDYIAGFDTKPEKELPGDNDYDQSVLRGKISYAEALTREKVRGQLIVNQKQEAELKKFKGDLLTKEECQEMLKNQQTVFLEALTHIGKIAGADFLAGMRPDVTKYSKRWIKEIRRLVDIGLKKL